MSGNSLSLVFHSRVQIGFEVVESKRAPGVQTLNQVHGAEGYEVNTEGELAGQEGDFVWTSTSLTLGVFVADCTAILMYGRVEDEERVAAVHAGWRGTAKGVIESALKVFDGASEIFAWMSPSICQKHYEVSSDVIDGLGPRSHKFTSKSGPGKFFLDLGGLQQNILGADGIKVTRSPLCTYCDPNFVSYRKSGRKLEARQLATIQLKRKKLAECSKSPGRS